MARVTGTLQLRIVARELRDAPKELRAELRTNLREAARPFADQIRAELPDSVPARYAGVLAPAIKVDVSRALSGSGAGFTLVVHAKGRTQDRDVKAVNAGLLRHKTWGHEPWHSQRVRGGFADRAGDKLAQRVASEAQKAVDDIADKLERG
jgi:hypothetical protein